MTSLRTKLILILLTVSALGIALGMLFASLSTSGEFRRFVFALNQEDLHSRLTSYYVDHGTWEGVEGELAQGLPPPPDPRPHSLRPGRFTLTDANGTVIVGGEVHPEGERLSSAVLAAFKPIEVSGQTVGWLILPGDAFAPTGREADFFRRVNNTLLLGAVAAFGVALAAGALAARSVTRPSAALTAATQAVAAGDFDRKVEIHSGDEFEILAASFNRMSEALKESQRLRRQMTADIAHELRTPLSVILGHLDALDDGVLAGSTETTQVIRDETDRLARLVEDLRVLTRADAGELALLRAPVDLEDLVDSVLVAFRPQARAKDIALSADVDPGLEMITVDPDRMRQVLANLVANALFHSPAGGQVTVRGEGTSEGVRLNVRDSGPGIPEGDLERVFDRFYRSDPARRREDGGSGLGLAIARSVVLAHGGRIWAENRGEGGASLVVALPRTGSVESRSR